MAMVSQDFRLNYWINITEEARKNKNMWNHLGITSFPAQEKLIFLSFPSKTWNNQLTYYIILYGEQQCRKFSALLSNLQPIRSSEIIMWSSQPIRVNVKLQLLVMSCPDNILESLSLLQSHQCYSHCYRHTSFCALIFWVNYIKEK